MCPDFHVFLSYNSSDQIIVKEIATLLRARGLRPWLDVDELRPGDRWQEKLEEIIETCRTAAVLIGPSGLGSWQGREMRGCLSELVDRKLPVLPVLLPGAPERPKLPLFFKDLTWVDLRNGLSGEPWERLIWGVTGNRPEFLLPSVSTERISRPGILRGFLDRRFPRIHFWLTERGMLAEPPELPEIRAYLKELRSRLRAELVKKTRLPLHARTVPKGDFGGRSKDPFVRPVHRIIRQVLGQAQGGDSADALIASVNRKSASVKNIVSRTLKSREPLILLGDPGSGKTITLQEAALDLANSELRRVFPTIPLYVRLGEFHVDGDVGPAEVLDYVKRAADYRIQNWIAELGASGRLIIFFDGMDEMSRDRYYKHTEALSRFADTYDKKIRTLFSCRITDFSPVFIHSRLVLLPLRRSQIGAYLNQFLQVRSLQIDGTAWKVSDLARRLASGELPIDSTNPFVLWLLCDYLLEERAWPESRVHLLRAFLARTYERKLREPRAKGIELPPENAALCAWSRAAFIITEKNRGAAIQIRELIGHTASPEEAEDMRMMIRIGKECGVLIESIPEEEYLIRFDNHRLQEYFTALWICEHEPHIDWLSKLDAPRWQETMINLVLMGGAEDGIKALAHAIKAEISAFQESKQEIPYEREATLANRVELGARVSCHSADRSPAVGEQLRPCLREAVDTLIKHGDPITQVKMMQACQHLNDVELLTALEKPLDSKMSWVRNQALILVVGPGRPGRIELATQMGIDLATNDFLSRWPAYVEALQVAGRKRAWPLACFLVATSCAVANLALLLFCSWGLFEALRSCYQFFFIPFPPYHHVIQGLLTLGATAFALRADRAHLWAWILWCVPIGHLLANTAFVLWKGNWPMVPGTIMISGGVCIPFAVLLPVLGLLLHQGTLMLYSVATLRPRETTRRYLSLAWTECGFEDLPDLFKGLGGIMAVGILGLSFLYLIGEILPKTSEKIGFSPWIVPLLFVVGLLSLPFIGPAAFRLVREQIESPSLTRPLNRGLGRIAVASTQVTTALGTRAGLRKTSTWVLLHLAGCFGLFLISAIVVSVLSFAGSFLAKLFVTLGLVAAAALFGYEVFLWMRPSLATLRPYPPGHWKLADWKSALGQGPQVQNEILLRSTHQSLSLQYGDFLQLLLEIKPLIQEDPALTTYLSLRYRLEQAIHKERQG